MADELDYIQHLVERAETLLNKATDLYPSPVEASEAENIATQGAKKGETLLGVDNPHVQELRRIATKVTVMETGVISTISEWGHLLGRLSSGLKAVKQAAYFMIRGRDDKSIEDLHSLVDEASKLGFAGDSNRAEALRRRAVKLSVRLFGAGNTYAGQLDKMEFPLVATTMFAQDIYNPYLLHRRELQEVLFAMQDVIDNALSSSGEHDQSSTSKVAANQEVLPTDPTAVMVVHGRDDKARSALFTFLRSVGLKPIEWSHALRATGEGSPYIGDVLDAAFSSAQAVVVLFTPDDIAYLDERLWGPNKPSHETTPMGQARPNVLFEAGLAFGRNAKRTILVEMGTLRSFSDIAGRHIIRMDNSPQKRQDLVTRLQTAGCAVDTTGNDWLTQGDFAIQG